MANQYFRFKQFTVNQEDCAMKVCTDACLQGAYTGWYVEEEGLLSAGDSQEKGSVSADDPSGKGSVGAEGSSDKGLDSADMSLGKGLLSPKILDIGTGTGLLSLMLAQRFSNAAITGIELDVAAAGQAVRNFAASPWSSSLKVLVGDARSLSLDTQYDLIITNPPFYESDLKSPDQLRNQAMHTTTLNYAALLDVIDKNLSLSGVFSVLLPYKPYATFEVLATQRGFYPRKVLHVKQTVNHDKFRTIAIFGREEAPRNEEVMAIKEAGNDYTAAFRALLQPYYLYL